MPKDRVGWQRRETLGQQRRRQQKLKHQRSLRYDAAMRARLLADSQGPKDVLARETPSATAGATTGGSSAGGDSMVCSSTAGAGNQKARRRTHVDLYTSEMMAPEWMVCVPDDLPSQWL